MELTQYATWLNDVFGLFDAFLLGLCHELAVSYADTLTPIANALGAAGHYGVMFGVLGVFLLIFRRTRMTGAAILLGVFIAGALGEFAVKDLVARPRPFEMSDTFNAWWQFVGSPDAHSYSFPSGHVAAATAAMIALAYGARRWYVSLLGVLMILAMCIDRMYLQVHYPSDVLGGFFLGFFGGIVGYAIIQGVWRLFGQHPDQLAEARARASRQASIEIPRGAEVQYAAVNMPSAQAPAQAQYAPQQAPQRPSPTRATQRISPQQAADTQVQPTSQQATQQMPSPQPTQRMDGQGASSHPQQPTRPAYAPSRYAQHAVPQTLQTAQGATVAVPPVPVQAASADTTQLIDMKGQSGEAARPTDESGFQMVEEYYREQ